MLTNYAMLNESTAAMKQSESSDDLAQLIDRNVLHVCVSISMTNHVLVRDYEHDFSDECDCNGHSYTQLESCGMQLSFLIMRRPYDAFRAHGVNGCHSECEQIQRPKTHQTFS